MGKELQSSIKGTGPIEAATILSNGRSYRVIPAIHEAAEGRVGIEPATIDTAGSSGRIPIKKNPGRLPCVDHGCQIRQ